MAGESAQEINEGFLVEVTFSLSLDGWTGVGPVQKVRKSIPGRGRNVCN